MSKTSTHNTTQKENISGEIQTRDCIIQAVKDGTRTRRKVNELRNSETVRHKHKNTKTFI